MKYIKMFEEFKAPSVSEETVVYIISDEANAAVFKNSVDESESESIDIVSLLESLNFRDSADFTVVSEADVESAGLQGDTIFVNVKGHKYGHEIKDTAVQAGLDIKEVARKFEKMLLFSTWKALRWLNKQTDIVSGSKKQEAEDAKKLEDLKEAVVTKTEDHTGKRIKLIAMGKDPRTGLTDPHPIPSGTEGTVTSVDSTGTLHVKWDNGRSLGVVPEVDKFAILPLKKLMKKYTENIAKLHENEVALKINESVGLPANAKTQFVKAVNTMLFSWGSDAPAEAVWAFNDFMIFYKTMTGVEIPDLDEDLSNWEEIEKKLGK